MKKNLKKKKGFTLIELVIVIAILGILALIAIPNFRNAQRDAKIGADITSAKTIANVTQVLITKEKINLPINESKGEKKEWRVIKVGVGEDGKDIEKELQSLPKPEYKKNIHKNFYSAVNNNGKVVVYVEGEDGSVPSSGDLDKGTQLYPEVGEGYKTGK